MLAHTTSSACSVNASSVTAHPASQRAGDGDLTGILPQHSTSSTFCATLGKVDADLMAFRSALTLLPSPNWLCNPIPPLTCGLPQQTKRKGNRINQQHTLSSCSHRNHIQMLHWKLQESLLGIVIKFKTYPLLYLLSSCSISPFSLKYKHNSQYTALIQNSREDS